MRPSQPTRRCAKMAGPLLSKRDIKTDQEHRPTGKDRNSRRCRQIDRSLDRGEKSMCRDRISGIALVAPWLAWTRHRFRRQLE